MQGASAPDSGAARVSAPTFGDARVSAPIYSLARVPVPISGVVGGDVQLLIVFNCTIVSAAKRRNKYFPTAEPYGHDNYFPIYVFFLLRRSQWRRIRGSFCQELESLDSSISLVS